MALRTIALCAGGGGLERGVDLATGGEARTVCWVEWEAFAVAHLVQQMEAGRLAPAPIWSDLRSFDARRWRGCVDLVTAGFPCQPWSLAGKQAGADDPRDMWPDCLRVVVEAAPQLVFLENVQPQPIHRAAQDLRAVGYRCAGGCFTASEVGASHKRERWFLLAHDHKRRRAERSNDAIAEEARRGRARVVEGCGSAVAHAQLKRLQGATGERLHGSGRSRGEPTEGRRGVDGGSVRHVFPPGPGDIDGWRIVLSEDDGLAPALPAVRLVADGMAPDRARWLSMLGNGVVPLEAAYALCALAAALGL